MYDVVVIVENTLGSRGYPNFNAIPDAIYEYENSVRLVLHCVTEHYVNAGRWGQ